jgi:hypothetical protein
MPILKIRALARLNKSKHTASEIKGLPENKVVSIIKAKGLKPRAGKTPEDLIDLLTERFGSGWKATFTDNSSSQPVDYLPFHALTIKAGDARNFTKTIETRFYFNEKGEVYFIYEVLQFGKEYLRRTVFDSKDGVSVGKTAKFDQIAVTKAKDILGITQIYQRYLP